MGAVSLPEDPSNAAPQTRAWYRFQDECAALLILKQLDADGLDGVYIEHSTDLILLPSSGVPELVSIKHREASQAGSGSWSWTEMKKRVLPHLFQSWLAADQHCRVTFCTTSGFTGRAYTLAKTCTTGSVVPPEIRRELSKQFRVTEQEVTDFVAALTLIDNMPDRNTITDVGVRAMERLLSRQRPAAVPHSDACYRELRRLIETTSTDVPETEVSDGHSTLPTLAEASRQVQKLRRSRKYLNAATILNLVLRTQDKLDAERRHHSNWPKWQADPHFTGRDSYLSDLDAALLPGEAVKVAPVVISGVAGSGKTSLALQYGATRGEHFRPVRISGATRESVIAGLNRLDEQNDRETLDGVASLRGPVTPELPANSAAIVIIDGVVDPDAVRGLIPRQSLCRVIITSTAPNIDPAYRQIKLGMWSSEESFRFVTAFLPDADHGSVKRLTHALHDHPLALVQAIGYCHATANSIERFLAIFDEQPMVVLEVEDSVGHADSIARTSRMLLDSALQQNPNAVELLRVLAFLASDPLDDRLFANMLAAAWVATPFLACEREEPKGIRQAWRRLFGRQGPAIPREIKHWRSPQAQEMTTEFRDAVKLDAAIATLLRHSLISRDDHHLAIHPLVGTIVRADVDDALPYLEVAFQVVLADLDENQGSGAGKIWRQINHLHSLVSAAFTLGYEGPAVLSACPNLVGVLPMTSRPAVQESRFWDVGAIALHARTVLEQQVQTGTAPPLPLIDLRLAESELHFEQNDPDTAVALLKEDYELCIAATDGEALAARSLCQAAVLAAEARRHDLVNEVNRLLPENDELGEYDTELQLDYIHAKVRILRFLNQIDEARRLNRLATQIVSTPTDTPISRRKVQSVHYDAAILGRDIDDARTVLESELALLKSVKEEWGSHPSWLLIMRTCSAADGAIEAGRFNLAEELLDEASSMVSEHFESDESLAAAVLGTRGRLYFLQHRAAEAKGELERAVRLMRRNPRASTREGLTAALIHLAQTESLLGNHSSAVAAADEAYRIDCTLFPDGHPEIIKDRDVLIPLQLIARGKKGVIAASEACEAWARADGLKKVGLTRTAGGGWTMSRVLAEKNARSGTIDSAVAWADQLLRAQGRTHLRWIPTPDSFMVYTSDPLGACLLNIEKGWVLFEIWATALPTLPSSRQAG